VSEHLDLRRVLIVLLGILLHSTALRADPLDGMSDPTRPKGWRAPVHASAGQQVRPADELRLQGIFSVGGRRSAMLSGQRVRVGDRVAGAQVIGIDKNKVILRVDGETVELASVLPEVKSPASDKGDGR
jgi:Tfp pilus assembly protein PilP